MFSLLDLMGGPIIRARVSVAIHAAALAGEQDGRVRLWPGRRALRAVDPEKRTTLPALVPQGVVEIAHATHQAVLARLWNGRDGHWCLRSDFWKPRPCNREDLTGSLSALRSLRAFAMAA